MSFVHPQILWWLFLALIPVIVHLFDFRKLRKIYFSNTRYLIDITENTRKEQVLRRLIIMSLRILAILFLVFAFARPVSTSDSVGEESSNYKVSIVIDNSLSMLGSGQNSDPHGDALEKATSIANQFPENTLFQLLTCDVGANEQRYMGREEFLEEIRKIKISPFARRLSDWINSIHKLNPDAGKTKSPVFFLSDFQKYQYSFAASKPGQAFLIPVGEQRNMNLSIDSIWFESPVQIASQPIKLNARIKNYGNAIAEKVPVRLYVEDAQKGLSDVQIAPNSSENISFSFQVGKNASYYGRIEIDDNPVVFDDKMYFALNIRSQIPVIRIHGEKAGTAAVLLFGKDSLFRFSDFSENAFNTDRLQESSFVVLDETGQLSPGLNSNLIDYIKNGGSVLLIPKGSDAEKTSSDFLNKAGVGTFGKKDTANTRIVSVNFRHSFYSGVFEAVPDKVSLPRISEHYSISNSKGESLITLQNGRSFLQMVRIGKGVLYLLAAPLSTSGNEFAHHPIFVPAMMQMAFLSNHSYRTMGYLSDKQGIEIPNTPSDNERKLVLKNLNGSFSMYPFVSTGNPPRVFLKQQVSEPGIYRLGTSENKDDILLALNFDREESDARFFNKEELDSVVKIDNGYKIIKNIADIKTGIIESTTHTPLWKISLLFVLLFLLAEVILLRIWGKNLA